MDKDINVVKVWDIFVRIFHWTLVGSIAGLYLSGEEFKGIHSRLGYFVACLVVARIIWGFAGTEYAKFNNFLYKPRTVYGYLKNLVRGNPQHYLGHNPAGGIMILVMLITLSVTVFSGMKALAIEGKGPLAKNSISIMRVVYADEDEHDDNLKYRDGQNEIHGDRQNEQKDEFWKDIHESMTIFMIFLVIAHIAGVMVSSLIHKENLIMGMITGKKKTK